MLNMLKIYNTLSREKERFEPLEENKVGLYTCGPTVYDYPHIGNYRAYVFSDILKRYLSYSGYDVKHVMNITDVDDKTIRNSREEGKKLKDFTEFYTQAFFEDLKKLNIKPADFFPRATENIREMLLIIERLLEKNLAYKGEDGSIYYEIRNFPDYGKLSKIELERLEGGASGRVKSDEYDKDHVEDFALWKAWDKEDGEVFWEPSEILGHDTKIPKGRPRKGFEIPRGRPGWHIECSAMSLKYLTDVFSEVGPHLSVAGDEGGSSPRKSASIDIHTGGVDLIFPHHENEIAQSEGATGKPFVRYWLHNEWLLVDGKKMSKSLGNFYTIRDIEEKGFSPLAFRYWLLGTHWRKVADFSWRALESAQAALKRLENFFLEFGEHKGGKINRACQEKFKGHMDNDLDTPGALAVLWDLVRNPNLKPEDKRATVLDFDKVFGLGFERLKPAVIPEEVMKLVEEREKARKNNDWEKADKLRDEIKVKGYEIKDTAEGPKVSPL